MKLTSEMVKAKAAELGIDCIETVRGVGYRASKEDR